MSEVGKFMVESLVPGLSRRYEADTPSGKSENNSV